MQPKLKSKLSSLEQLGIVGKVNYPTDWVNSLTMVHKGDGDLRLCLDPKDLNEAIKRQHFQMPTFEDISSKLAGSSVFSILDSKDAFMHVKLSKESSYLCVLIRLMGDTSLIDCLTVLICQVKFSKKKCLIY